MQVLYFYFFTFSLYFKNDKWIFMDGYIDSNNKEISTNGIWYNFQIYL